jgi:hypothetical protein
VRVQGFAVRAVSDRWVCGAQPERRIVHALAPTALQRVSVGENLPFKKLSKFIGSNAAHRGVGPPVILAELTAHRAPNHGGSSDWRKTIMSKKPKICYEYHAGKDRMTITIKRYSPSKKTRSFRLVLIPG